MHISCRWSNVCRSAPNEDGERAARDILGCQRTYYINQRAEEEREEESFYPHLPTQDLLPISAANPSTFPGKQQAEYFARKRWGRTEEERLKNPSQRMKEERRKNTTYLY